MLTRQVILALALGGVAAALVACGGGPATPTEGGADYSVQLLGLGSGDYRFDPKDLTLTSGRTYTLSLTSDAEYHTWSVKNPAGGYLVDSQVLPKETKIVQFTAPAAGTYEVVCIPHVAQGMTGTLTVR